MNSTTAYENCLHIVKLVKERKFGEATEKMCFLSKNRFEIARLSIFVINRLHVLVSVKEIELQLVTDFTNFAKDELLLMVDSERLEIRPIVNDNTTYEVYDHKKQKVVCSKVSREDADDFVQQWQEAEAEEREYRQSREDSPCIQPEQIMSNHG